MSGVPFALPPFGSPHKSRQAIDFSMSTFPLLESLVLCESADPCKPLFRPWIRHYGHRSSVPKGLTNELQKPLSVYHVSRRQYPVGLCPTASRQVQHFRQRVYFLQPTRSFDFCEVCDMNPARFARRIRFPAFSSS
jgi:hypothetical protein